LQLQLLQDRRKLQMKKVRLFTTLFVNVYLIIVN